MIIFPDKFVKTDFPGYFWNKQNQCLYSIKVDGVLKKLKAKNSLYSRTAVGIKIEKGITNYPISCNGRRRTILRSELIKKYNQKNSEILKEMVDIRI